MFRHFLTLVAALSLALCIACVTLWVRSYYRIDVYRAAPGAFPATRSSSELLSFRPQFTITSARGQVQLLTRDAIPDPNAPLGLVTEPLRPNPIIDLNSRHIGDRHWVVAGIHYFHREAQPLIAPNVHAQLWGFHYLTLPWWQLTALTVIFPAAWFLHLRKRARRRRRLRQGLCPDCGYDCRATPGRCPECGKVLDGALPK